MDLRSVKVPAPPNLTERERRIENAFAEFLSRRNQGDPISPEEFGCGYPDLSPELTTALRDGIRQIRQIQEARGSATTEGAPPVGPHIPGYLLRREISRGSQGTVYEAEQEKTLRTVAVKVIAGVSRHSAARFEREVQSLAKINHRGIVGVVDRGRTPTGAYYLVMDFVPGADLDCWIGQIRGTPNAQRKILQVFADIADALHAAHDTGIVHRDLKPSNIRVALSGQPCLIDFGLAHLADDQGFYVKALTQTGDIVGSVPWASPEQVAGRSDRASVASDVYSLGVLLYTALTGKHPYPVDGSFYETVRNICNRPPVNPRKVADMAVGTIDASLASIVLKCLAKKPTDRIASAQALAQTITNYLHGNYRVSRRAPKLIAFIALDIILLTSLGMIWSNYARRQRYSTELQFRLPTLTNSLGMQFATIPVGTFLMGSSPYEIVHQFDARAHPVRLTHLFGLGITEVTRRQYRQVMGKLPPFASVGSEDCPVDGVSWRDAQEFCRRLSGLDGNRYRLPTEAEWEYACRAGQTKEFDGLPTMNGVAWCSQNSDARLHPVAELDANRWGLYDMHGNVAEWVADNYRPDWGSSFTTNPRIELGTRLRVIRGGSAFSSDEECRASARDHDLEISSSRGYGFRVAVDLPEK